MAWDAEISPIASAEQVLGKWFISVRATSIRICAELGESRRAAAISSRSDSSTPSQILSLLLDSSPATATIARCKSACNQAFCRSKALKKSIRAAIGKESGSIATKPLNAPIPGIAISSSATRVAQSTSSSTAKILALVMKGTIPACTDTEKNLSTGR